MSPAQISPPDPKHPNELSVFRYLRDAGTPLDMTDRFSGGFAAAVWDRDARELTRYGITNHHTLSLYVEHGDQISKQVGQGWQASAGAGDLCLMPLGSESTWSVQGQVRLFHLYIMPDAFDRAALEMLDRDPARLSLREDAFFRNPLLESLIRSVILGLSWHDMADRMAISHAAQSALAWLLGHMTDMSRTPQPLRHEGGLAPAQLRRVCDFMDAHLSEPLEITDIAALTGLSTWHFARAFRQSTGVPPHAWLIGRRIDHARTLLRSGHAPSAVAHECGFSSHSHFAARFRSETGLSPSRFVKEYGARQI